MATPHQKSNWIKRALKNSILEFTFPELQDADNVLRKTPKDLRGNIQSYPGAEMDAFGPDRMADPRFRKQLRKLQEKYNIIQVV